MTPATEPAPAAPPATVTTSLRALTLNCRLPSLSDDKPDDADEDVKVRLPKLAALINGFAPSIAILQECDLEDTLVPLLKRIGEWTAVGRGKVWVTWDPDKWRQVRPAALLGMPNGGEADRRLIIVELESLSTGGRLVVVGTHLGVHMANEAKVRIGQAQRILLELKGFGVYEQTPVLLGGDFNDTPPASEPGVRNTFDDGWLRLQDLRARLDDASMHGDGYDTHHGYGPRRERGRWLDDLFTSPALVPVEGWVLRTDAEAPAAVRFATDHNAVAARLRFTHRKA